MQQKNMLTDGDSLKITQIVSGAADSLDRSIQEVKEDVREFKRQVHDFYTDQNARIMRLEDRELSRSNPSKN